MSSRQEEKERRRQERIAREQSEKRAAARRKRLQMVGGVLLGVAAVVGVVIALVVTAGGDDGDANEPNESASLPKLPQQQATSLEAAADAAGCRVINAKYEGAGHEEREFTASDYQTNPPTSGTHFPQWAQDGIFQPGEVPPLGELVHTLEHGRIDVQYKPGTPARVVRQLEAFLAENEDGYHMLLFPNPTGMKYQVAATAWTHLLGCEKWDDKAIDALRTFRQRFIDKGPEKVA